MTILNLCPPVTWHVSRSQGVGLLLLIGVLIPLVTNAQKVEVPESGHYVAAPNVRSLKINGRRMSGEFLTSKMAGVEALDLKVSPCGDSLEWIAEEGTIDLEFAGDRYVGSAVGDNFVIAVEFFPVTTSHHRVMWKAYHGDDEVEWDLDFYLDFMGPTPQSGGLGASFPTPPKIVRKGIVVTETRRYSVFVSNFTVNDATLLPGHIERIEEGLGVIRNPKKHTEVCASEQDVRFDPFVTGYASQTGPESVNIGLARRRAGVVAEYLGDKHAQHFTDSKTFILGRPDGRIASRPFEKESANLTGLSRKNLESACERAATFGFTVTRTYYEPPTKNKLKTWLKEDLAGTAKLDPMVATGPRLRVKARYLLGMNFLQMIDDGICKCHADYVKQTTPFHWFVSHEKGPREGLNEAYKEAARADAYVRAGDRRYAAFREQEAAALDPCSRYTSKPNCSARNAADAAELNTVGSCTKWNARNLNWSETDFESVFGKMSSADPCKDCE